MRKNKRYKVLAEVRLNKPRWEASRHNQHQKDQVYDIALGQCVGEVISTAGDRKYVCKPRNN